MAVRILCLHPAPVAVRSRPLTSLSTRLAHPQCSRTTQSILQRRFVSDEAETRFEPEASGAAEAQHGENSIAAASQAQNPQEIEEIAQGSSTLGDPALGARDPENVSEAEHVEPLAQSDQSEQSEPTVFDQIAGHASSAQSQAAEYGQAASEAFSAASSAAAQSAGLGRPQDSEVSRSAFRDEQAPSQTVYVGNLFFDATGEDLKREFSNVGEVTGATVKMDARGLSRG